MLVVVSTNLAPGLQEAVTGAASVFMKDSLKEVQIPDGVQMVVLNPQGGGLTETLGAIFAARVLKVTSDKGGEIGDLSGLTNKK